MEADKIQKLNDLAGDLMKRGIARTSFEAAQIAEGILGGVSQIPKPEDYGKTPLKELSENDFNQILNKDNEQLLATIRDLNGQLIELRKEIISIKAKLDEKQDGTNKPGESAMYY